ncbi:MAG: HAD-IIB family hydrolase [Armatimonadota bacterium]
MRKIRLVALDIDGTVVDETGHVVDANRGPIAAAQAQGALIVLATARVHKSAARFAKELGLASPIICCNGALARWPERSEELWHLRLPMEAARSIAWFADDHRYELATTVDDVTYFRQRTGQSLGFTDEGYCVLETNAAALATPPTRILAVGHESIDAILTAQREPLRSDVAFWPERRDNTYTSLTMVNPQASKGWALSELCGRLGIPLEDTLAVGDSQSDIEMFVRVGISVAVGGAPDDVMKSADHVAPLCRDGAVAWALRSFVL